MRVFRMKVFVEFHFTIELNRIETHVCSKGL